MYYLIRGKNYHLGKKVDEGIGIQTDCDEINYVLSMINYAYIPYYIQETEKILKGKRDEFEIHITDDEEYDAPDDYIIVHKDMFYGKNEKEKTIQTSQLLEFLKIMKKEIGIGDEVVIPDYRYLENRFSGLHLKPQVAEHSITWQNDPHAILYDLGENAIVLSHISQKNVFGYYSAKVDMLTRNQQNNITVISKSTKYGFSNFFPEEWSPQTVMDKINEAYDTAQHVSGTKNTWLGHTKAGEPIEFFNSGVYPNNQRIKDKIISAWPKI